MNLLSGAASLDTKHLLRRHCCPEGICRDLQALLQPVTHVVDSPSRDMGHEMSTRLMTIQMTIHPLLHVLAVSGPGKIQLCEP